ncbi:zonular occludens toxin domain-containing protein [Rheinheimera metallidurans]|uniref:zonular occludens toxin domain-containing protein n=1 Tax=Rheinheimera metallidurans TaxID=2925781 RepID=UPI00300248A6
MINGLSGRPGAGKTYEAVVTHILPALKQGRKVVINIPLNVDWFVGVLGEEVRDLITLVDGGFHNYGQSRYFSKAKDFLQYDTWRNKENQGVYFFVDEAHLAMPQGATDKELKEYMSMHRHYGHDIMLITQNFRKVDRDIKDMVQNCYYCTKLSFLGRDEKYIVKVADGVSRNIITTHEREYDPKYYPAYQSHTKSTGSVTEATTADVTKWYQRWTTKGAVICFVLAAFILMANLSRDKPDTEEKARQTLQNLRNGEPISSTAQLNSPPAVTSSPQQQQNRQEKPDKSKGLHPFNNVDLHLAGWYQDFDRKGRFKKTFYFAVSRNGQYLSEITNTDLALAGYNVQMLADCVARVSYGDNYERFVMCDAPTAVVTGAGQQIASLD